MIEELQLINHWLQSGEGFFLRQQGIDNTYFFALRDVVDWIENFYLTQKVLPTIDLVCVEFEEFRKLVNLDPLDYLVNIVKEAKAYTEYRPVIEQNAALIAEGKTIEAMWKMKSDVDLLLRKYTSKISHYDWIKNATDRYEAYLKKHGTEGLSGLTTGIASLDELTGGWKSDDLILLAGRTNEGKQIA